MRFLNRRTELGLNILQHMYKNRDKAVTTLGELTDSLKESELFLYQILRVLKMTGYVYSVRGPAGGYKLVENAERATLKAFMEAFGKEYVPNPLLAGDFASEEANRAITAHAELVILEDLFHQRSPKPPVMRIKWPTPGGAA